MTFNLQKEQLLSFQELALSGSKPVPASRMYEWRRRGVAGIKLEAVKKDGVWHSSLEALQRFQKAVTVVRGMRAIKQAGRRPELLGDRLAKMARKLSKASGRSGP